MSLASGTAAARNAASAAQAPTLGALYKDGPSGRYLLGGDWLFRTDGGVGLRERFQQDRSSSGWSTISVPNAWNAGKPTVAWFTAAVRWYRKDFTLPASARNDTWIVRFESVNNTATVWLNGNPIGTHRGAFLPFEIVLPRAELNRTGTNRLVLRVSDAYGPTDLPPRNDAGPRAGVGGWWNYGGILREVYLRRVEAIDFSSVQVLPHLACPTCAAEISYSVVLRNDASGPRRVSLRTSYGGTVGALGEATIAPGASATFSGQVRIAAPILWTPASPHLYSVTLDASAGLPGARSLPPVAHYFLESGIRTIGVVGGHLYLNSRPLNIRGVGYVEDSPTRGSALTPAQQLASITLAKTLGATMIRSQYPLSGYEQQLADELGLMLWSEIPVYQVRDVEIGRVAPKAVAALREDILDNGNHPSIVIWSIANELSPVVSPVQRSYLAAAVRVAHALDPTRPVGLAFQGYPAIACQASYAPVQVLGLNDYFGWYPGPSGGIADPATLSDYLTQEHACYPRKALIVSEFGAEANRDGPVDERGTFEFQSQFITAHLAAFAANPWLSGAIYWALQDFLVRPGWTGGNPYPTPPIFSKGLIDWRGKPKPAFAVVQSAFAATKQVG